MAGVLGFPVAGWTRVTGLQGPKDTPSRRSGWPFRVGVFGDNIPMALVT